MVNITFFLSIAVEFMYYVENKYESIRVNG